MEKKSFEDVSVGNFPLVILHMQIINFEHELIVQENSYFLMINILLTKISPVNIKSLCISCYKTELNTEIKQVPEENQGNIIDYSDSQ